MFCIVLKKNSCWSVVDSGSKFFVLASYFHDCFIKCFGVCVVCID